MLFDRILDAHRMAPIVAALWDGGFIYVILFLWLQVRFLLVSKDGMCVGKISIRVLNHFGI